MTTWDGVCRFQPQPVRLYQLELEGLPADFPPLRSLHRTNLPLAAWPLLGRERELEKIRIRLRRRAAADTDRAGTTTWPLGFDLGVYSSWSTTSSTSTGSRLS
jgi:hypothetical protein